MAEVDDYLAELDAEDARIIGDAYATARSVVPEAEQGLSYGMPALLLLGRPLLSVMRAKSHIGVYPYSGVVVGRVVESLPPVDGLTWAKGTVRLPLHADVPKVVIRELVLARRDEIEESLARKQEPRSARQKRAH